MKKITDKQYEDWKRYQKAVIHGQILTPDALKIICNALDNDPEAIGRHILTVLNKISE